MKSLKDYILESLNQKNHDSLAPEYFERIVIKTIFERLTDEEITECEFDYPLIRGNSGRGLVDLFLPHGAHCLDIRTPLAIEIKYKLLLNNFYQQINTAQRWFNENFNDNGSKEYWTVYNHSSVRLEGNYDSKIKFIPFQELIHMLDTREEEWNDNRIGKESETDNVPDSDENNVQILLSKLRNDFFNKNCSFILGAGVSVEEGAKPWKGLLTDILNSSTYHNPIEGADYDCVNDRCGYSSIITARYILQQTTGKDAHALIAGYIRNSLYNNPVRDHVTNSTTLSIIAEIIKKYDVESVLTLNYDNFLESILIEFGRQPVPYVGKGAPNKGEIPIFHLHGYVPENKKDELAMLPVLSEKEYHELYADSFNWANVEILRALTRNTCVFVGLSMTDPNLRRLLDIARYNDDPTPRHYIFLHKTPLDAKATQYSAKDNKHWEIIERQMNELGLNVVWYNYNFNDSTDHSDLKNKLKHILNK